MITPESPGLLLDPLRARGTPDIPGGRDRLRLIRQILRVGRVGPDRRLKAKTVEVVRSDVTGGRQRATAKPVRASMLTTLQQGATGATAAFVALPVEMLQQGAPPSTDT